MAIAPTATISLISGTTPCVEPIFRNIYIKENVGGSFIVVNQHMIDELQSLNLWNKEMIEKVKFNDGSIASIKEIPEHVRKKYKEAFEISPEWVLRAAGQRSKWIDQSASTNVFLDTSSGKILNDTYMLAWQLGLKTTYYLRSQGASSTEKMTANDSVMATPSVPAADIDQSAPKLCKLDEPDCEACQ
jgi:ribonucleoside-diphosphate reductase alpha chain